MARASVKGDSQVANIVEQWNKLNDVERIKLIPAFLHSIVGWRTWSVSDTARLDWLESQFRKAEVPFRK